ncbi:AarF/ABC1/UbiB kinase family protein [Loktanella sp. F6476L]|uniref:ABC1 kinase family protein n=1 Tax=Loktanella sp. F6476L TaxID=2926405 RepID=UPI001FF6A981|nr:AarF/ABC1/UbiB kinase family protein [Loktanella sp. F6476L]MCK0120702.1 AarF/ABC1/UbiB kinase family protein [Loktanella sp. F6476L]
MTAGVMGNMAVGGAASLGRGQRPSMRDLLLTPRNVGRVADELAKMRGAAMKIGQLVSMDTGDVLPPELSQIMARLRDDAHIMPPAQLKKMLNAQWPDGWLRSFTKFDVRPIAAASIGQVHRATLKDGRDLAIKVQYPGVAQSIDSDVANVGALIRISGLLPKGFTLAPYLDEARKQLHEETDYTREGAQMMRFRDLLKDDETFAVPDLQDDWSTRQILAMTYMDGAAIEDLVDAPQTVRYQVATDLISLTLRELFTFGLMQTDPNFANYRYGQTSGQIVLLDFGATRVIGAEFANLYRQLILAGIARDTAEIRRVALDIGFIDGTTKPEHSDRILTMIDMVFAELTAKPVIDFADSTLSRKMQAEGMKLAEDGFVPPPLPIDVLFLQRKFAGMFLLAARLKAVVDVRSLIAPYLA